MQRSWWLSTCLPSSLSTLVRLFVLSVSVLCFTLNGFSCSLFLTVKGYFAPAPFFYLSSSFIYLIFLSFLFLSPFSFSLSLYFFSLSHFLSAILSEVACCVGSRNSSLLCQMKNGFTDFEGFHFFLAFFLLLLAAF